jgi:bacterial/archaeal transporter family-2 protein
VSPARRTLGIGLAVLGGFGVALQSRINGELAHRLGDSLLAAVISFGSGLVLVATVVLVVPAGRRGVRLLRRAVGGGALPVWTCLGGLSGGYFVATQGTVAALGLAVFTVAVISGQVASSLVVDRVGLGPGGPRPVSPTRVAGAALALVAVVIAVADRLGSPEAVVLAVLPALAGVFIAWQQGVNGRVQAAAGALVATLLNFVTGTALVAFSFVVVASARGWPAPHLPGEPWLYSGGAVGVLFILVATTVVRFTGVLVLGLSMISGQVLGSVLIDLVAPARGDALTVNTLIGATLALVAVVVGARRN